LLCALAGGLAAVGYFAFLRPRHLRWGATDEEVREVLPGDAWIPGARMSATHAVTIHASAEDVWPWIVQIGQNKAGFYSYTFLENLLGCEMENASEVHPEWQSLRIGDEVYFHPDFPPAVIVELVKNKHLVIGSDLDKADPSTWSFVLKDLGHGYSRLIVRLRARTHAGLARLGELAALEPAHFIMERKMMLTIKHLAEERSTQLAMSLGASR